jgi:hypothetical protein
LFIVSVTVCTTPTPPASATPRPQLAEWGAAGASRRSGDPAPFRRPLATVLPDPADPIRVRQARRNLTMLKRMVQRAPCPAAADIDLSDSFSISVCTRCRVSRRRGPGRGAVSRLMRIKSRIETTIGRLARKILSYNMSLLFKQS